MLVTLNINPNWAKLDKGNKIITLEYAMII